MEKLKIETKILYICQYQDQECLSALLYESTQHHKIATTIIDQMYKCAIDGDNLGILLWINSNLDNQIIKKSWFEYACKHKRHKIRNFMMGYFNLYIVINGMYNICDLDTFELCVLHFGIDHVVEYLKHDPRTKRKTIYADKAVLLYQKYHSPVLIQQLQSWSRHAFGACVRELGMNIVKTWCPQNHFKSLHKSYMLQYEIIKKRIQKSLIPNVLANIINDYTGNDIDNVPWK